MITPSQVEAIFSTALDKSSAAERAAYLDHACDENAELRRRVERLLEAHPQAEGFLARPAVEALVKIKQDDGRWPVGACMESGSPRRESVGRLAEEFVERHRRGERPTLSEYTSQYPDHAERIRDLFPALDMMERIALCHQIDALPEVEWFPDRRPGEHPEQIGDYRILGEIGRGGMGVVYEAEQVSLGRRVALKVLPGQVSRDRKVQERFRREARAAARLHHTNIVPVYEVGQEGEVRFYAMQFIQGLGLDAVITELRRLQDRARSRSQIEAIAGGRSLWSRGEPSHQGVASSTRGERVEVSPVLRSILTGRFDSGGQCPEVVGAPESRLAGACAEGLATTTETGTENRATGTAAALRSTETGSETAGNRTSRQQTYRAVSNLSPLASPSASSAILPGGSLLSSVESGHHAFFRSLAQIGRQVAGGLAYAHARGIVHRDIKPSNLLLDTEGVVWIADFGLAKGEDEGLTHTGDILGTLRYMAPERFRGEGDARADVYALGLTLYELLTLRSGYESTDRLELIEQIKTQEPQKPRAVDARIPRDLETIVLKAIEKDPKTRYPSAEAMGEDLSRFLADEPIRARQVGAAERSWRWCQRNKAVAGLLGAIAVSLVLGTVVSMYFALAANRNADQAMANAHRADLEAKRANREAQNATKEAEHARHEKWLSDHRLYAAVISQAQQAWRDNQPELARQHLKTLEPSRPEDPDLRGFEWYYLDRLRQLRLRTLAGHEGSVQSLAFAPDGRTLASAGADHTLRLWNTATGAEVRILRGHTGIVFGVAFAPDGRTLASTGRSPDRTVRLWDAGTGQPLRTLRGHATGVYSVAYSPDGRILASTGSDRTVRLWDIATGREIRGLSGNENVVLGVAFAPDGRTLASAGADRRVRLWDAASGQEIRVFSGHKNTVYGVAFAPDGRTLASAGADRTVRLWDAASGQEIRTLLGHTAQVLCVTFSPDGRHIASAGADRIVRLWDAASGQELRTLIGHEADINSVAFAPNGRTLASAGADRIVKLWDTSVDLEALTLRGHSGLVESVTFSPDGKRVASAGADHTVRLWDAVTGLEILILGGHSASVATVAFAPDGSRIASAGGDRTVRLWDAATGQVVRIWTDQPAPVTTVAFSPDGLRIAIAASDRSVRLCDATTGRELQAWRGQSSAVTGVAYSPDGHTLAIGVGDAVILHDATRDQEVMTLRGHRGTVNAVAFAPDGRTLASVGDDQTLRLWDATTGREVWPPVFGHAARIHTVVFSPDGHRIASAGEDAAVRLWDAVTGQELMIFHGHSAQVVGLGFSPDGRRLASASGDGTVRIWDATPMDRELWEFHEARSVVEFLFRKSVPTVEVLDRIRRDASLTEPVRGKALELVELYGRSRVVREAESRVDSLFATWRLRAVVVESLRRDATLAEPVRRQALALSEQAPEDPELLNRDSWAVASRPDLESAAYRLPLRQAEAACRLAPESGMFLTTLGIAQYRTGQYREAVNTLTKAAAIKTKLEKGPRPADLAFLALCWHRLRQTEQARADLSRLRQLLSAPEEASNTQAHAFLREAEVIELDLVFPADPFAR